MTFTMEKGRLIRTPTAESVFYSSIPVPGAFIYHYQLPLSFSFAIRKPGTSPPCLPKSCAELRTELLDYQRRFYSQRDGCRSERRARKAVVFGGVQDQARLLCHGGNIAPPSGRGVSTRQTAGARRAIIQPEPTLSSILSNLSTGLSGAF